MFNFALGLFVPPAFKNINWKAFMVFGTLCMAAAVQFFLTYPEVSKIRVYSRDKKHVLITSTDRTQVVRGGGSIVPERRTKAMEDEDGPQRSG